MTLFRSGLVGGQHLLQDMHAPPTMQAARHSSSSPRSKPKHGNSGQSGTCTDTTKLRPGLPKHTAKHLHKAVLPIATIRQMIILTLSSRSAFRRIVSYLCVCFSKALTYSARHISQPMLALCRPQDLPRHTQIKLETAHPLGQATKKVVLP